MDELHACPRECPPYFQAIDVLQTHRHVQIKKTITYHGQFQCALDHSMILSYVRLFSSMNVQG